MYTTFELKKFEQLIIEDECFTAYEFINCEFINCTFTDIQLEKCKVLECVFRNCKIINLSTKNTHVRNAELSGCSLLGIDWQAMVSEESVASPLFKVRDSVFKYNHFVKINLLKMDFNESVLQDCIFHRCSMKEAVFKGCNLERTQFTDCDLRGSDFREAFGYYVDITNCQVKKANFSFPEVGNLLNCLDIKID